MPLSISNSEEKPTPSDSRMPDGSPRTFMRATTVLLAGLVLLLLSAELFSRVAFPRISRIEGRIHSDELEVRTMPSAAPNSRPNLLLAGNSLLLRGLEYPSIQKEMASDAHVVRFVIENTEYVDWYYGLQHLFRSGVRPTVVILCLNIGQATSSRTLGDYSARHLFGVGDIFPVARETGMGPTRASGMMLAHWSAFYASRASIRNFLLNKADPPYAAAMHSLADNLKNPMPADDELVARARERLSALELICREAGVRFVLLIPPASGGRNDLLASAAQLEKINYYYPFPLGTLGREFFRADGAHLNEKGAAIFTKALVSGIRERILAQPLNAETSAQSRTPGARF